LNSEKIWTTRPFLPFFPHHFTIFFCISQIFSLFSSVFSKPYHYSTCLSSMFFHIFSLFSLSFFRVVHIFSLFNLSFFHIVHILSLFDLPFSHIFHIIWHFNLLFFHIFQLSASSPPFYFH
jgi:hypothetical protein